MIRKNLRFFQLMVSALLFGGILSSCSYEMDLPGQTNNGMIAKAPKMAASSNNHYWGLSDGTRSANVNGNMWYQDWDRPTNVTQEEIDKVLEAVKDPRVNAVNDITIEWENFWVQQVYKGQTPYYDYNNTNRGLGSELMNELQVWNDNGYTYWPVQHPGGYEEVNNFNKGDNQTTYTDGENGYVYEGTTLMTGMSAKECDPSKQFAYKNSADGSQLYYDYIVIVIDGEYYVCFDFYADNRDNPTATANKDHYIDRDWIFNDWIVKISPAYHVGETPEKPAPEEPKEEPKCDKCGHPAHDGICEDCDENKGCNKLPDFERGRDEVEVNLALDGKVDNNLLESHLSIHVRAVTDVEVFIPVPAEYYCDKDDMEIVLKHDVEFVHGGKDSFYQTEYKIGENIVTLNVKFEEGGIRVWTEGINQAVIDYCWDKYQDGITFEVWNYFNDPEDGLPYISIEDLKTYLDQATVEFKDKIPGHYINAFGKENDKYSSDNTDGQDFHVTPVERQIDEFEDPYEGPHFNDSENNDIYKSKALESEVE